MPAGGIPFGHFILHRRLARGGMAEVFLARQRGLEGFDRRVAVKRILPHLSERPDFVKMFLDEARLAARLSHPNIVHIYEFGKVDQDYFIAMEYVEGVHAGQLIKLAATEPLPPVLVARIGADAASALAYAHRLEDADGTPLQVVHRDISPQNLMLSYDGVVKLVDFGIAKAASVSEETQPGVVKGKYAYMSPEQTMGKSLDGRSDVFSLALVMWEMLAGRLVFDRRDPAAAMRAIRDGRFPPIEEVAPRVPAPLAAAIGQALEVDRDERVAAAELGVTLEAFIKSAPDLATGMQLAEWIRERFPRASTTAQHPALPAEGTPQKTVAAPITRATSVGAASIVTPNTAGPAIALPPREATFLHTAALEEDSPTDDDRTALVAPTRPTRAPTAHRQLSAGKWVLAILLMSLAGIGVVVAAGALAGDEPAPAPDARAAAAPARPDAGGLTVVPLAPDAAPPPDAAPAPLALASLDVITQPPGAKVQLAGRTAPAQRAPASFQDLEPGDLFVHVTLDGHEPLDRDVTLAPGERRTLELALVKKDKPDRGRDRDRDRDRKPPAGTLNVRTTPYSVVHAGGRRLGETPFVKELPAGTYTLTFTNPERGTTTRTVTIRPGETTKLKFDL